MKINKYSLIKNNATLDVDSIGNYVDDHPCESVLTNWILKSCLSEEMYYSLPTTSWWPAVSPTQCAATEYLKLKCALESVCLGLMI